MSRYEREESLSESEPDSEESSITDESQWSNHLEESELEESDNGTLCDDEPDQDGSERESENLIEEDQCRISSAGEHSRSSVAAADLSGAGPSGDPAPAVSEQSSVQGTTGAINDVPAQGSNTEQVEQVFDGGAIPTRVPTELRAEPSVESDESDIPSDIEEQPITDLEDITRQVGATATSITDRCEAAPSVPLVQTRGRASADTQANASMLVRHPFPGETSQLSAEIAQRTSPWKLSYLCHLLNNNPWKDTLVDGTEKAKSLTLTRFDGQKFPLKVCSSIFYVLFGDRGLELINTEKISLKIPDDAHGKMIKRRNDATEEWCVRYTRVLATEQAERECQSEHDYVSTSASGMHRPSSLGARSLREY